MPPPLLFQAGMGCSQFRQAALDPSVSRKSHPDGVFNPKLLLLGQY